MANKEIDNFEVTEEAGERMKKLAKEMRHNPALKVTGHILYALAMVYYLSATKEGREALKNPEFRKTLIDKEKRTGLLEDTILSPILYHPNSEYTSLIKTQAQAGRWTSYDFRRSQEFYPKKVKQLDNGKLIAFILPEIIGNDPNKFTPTNTVNIFDITHVLTIETPSIQQVIEYGYLKETTYKKAYDEAGTNGKFDKYLQLKNLLDTKIYQVTPKGNGMLFLATDAGEQIREEQKVAKLIPQIVS